MYQKWGKRVFDLTLACTLIVVAAPLMILIALLVRIKLGSPVLFRQERTGLHGEAFVMSKFRSMNPPPANGTPVDDAERLTSFGMWLRSTSLDELPELFDVISGDMSLVGPRPLLPEYLPLYSARHRRRHEVRPSLTGLAQVRGRNVTTWAERLELDIAYADSVSLRLDLRIVMITVVRVLRRQDTTPHEYPVMGKYEGY